MLRTIARLKGNLSRLVQQTHPTPANQHVRSQWDTTPEHPESPEEYWTRINVTDHYEFKDQQDSLDYFHWRNMLYSNYIENMPVSGFDNLDILDYGCGPGHDLVGFAYYSKPRRLVGVDVSTTSLSEAKTRLELHSDDVEFIQIDEKTQTLPLEDSSFDLIHSSGVLHHVPDALRILQEFRRIVRPTGKCQIMVYNRDSIFFHLGISHQRILVEKQFSGLSLEEAFQRSTDGPDCPISRCYRPKEFIALGEQAGFDSQLRGVGVTPWEMQLLPSRFDAMAARELAHESRKFLYDLSFDEKLRPIYNGHVAGLDGCFELTPRE